ncbi:MAG: hypothetical protein GY928_38590 [Colwellia sp.]|nr:hypothetical protein [Colwellia sp.]
MSFEGNNIAEQDTIFVITGTLYEKDMPMLPGADEPHKIPSGYWKIIIKPSKNLADIKTAAFIFNQDTPRGDKEIRKIILV